MSGLAVHSATALAAGPLSRRIAGSAIDSIAGIAPDQIADIPPGHFADTPPDQFAGTVPVVGQGSGIPADPSPGSAAGFAPFADRESDHLFDPESVLHN